MERRPTVSVQSPAARKGIHKSVLPPKCQRSRRASKAQRVGWNTVLGRFAFWFNWSNSTHSIAGNDYSRQFYIVLRNNFKRKVVAQPRRRAISRL